MPIDMDYFRDIQGAHGLDNIKQVEVEETKARLKNELLYSVSCEYMSKRNGESQKFIVTPTERTNMMNISAFPDEDLEIGDTIDCYDQKWLVTEKSAINNFQWHGKMLQCNQLFKFQTGTSDVYEYWGVLDNGVYSTTEKNSDMATVPDQQYKIYLPYNEHTAKIYLGKRLATETWVDGNGNTIMLCYRVTATDSVSESYGNGKLLILKFRSEQYVPSKDEIDNMICDYIAATNDSNDDGGDWI